MTLTNCSPYSGKTDPSTPISLETSSKNSVPASRSRRKSTSQSPNKAWWASSTRAWVSPTSMNDSSSYSIISTRGSKNWRKLRKGYLSPEDIRQLFKVFGQEVSLNDVQNSFRYAKLAQNRMSFEDFKEHFLKFWSRKTVQLYQLAQFGVELLFAFLNGRFMQIVVYTFVGNCRPLCDLRRLLVLFVHLDDLAGVHYLLFGGLLQLHFWELGVLQGILRFAAGLLYTDCRAVGLERWGFVYGVQGGLLIVAAIGAGNELTIIEFGLDLRDLLGSTGCLPVDDFALWRGLRGWGWRVVYEDLLGDLPLLFLLRATATHIFSVKWLQIDKPSWNVYSNLNQVARRDS